MSETLNHKTYLQVRPLYISDAQLFGPLYNAIQKDDEVTLLYPDTSDVEVALDVLESLIISYDQPYHDFRTLYRDGRGRSVREVYDDLRHQSPDICLLLSCQVDGKAIRGVKPCVVDYTTSSVLAEVARERLSDEIPDLRYALIREPMDMDRTYSYQELLDLIDYRKLLPFDSKCSYEALDEYVRTLADIESVSDWQRTRQYIKKRYDRYEKDKASAAYRLFCSSKFKNRSLDDKLTYLEDLHAYTQLMSGFYADRHMLDLQLLKVLPQESMVA